MRFGSGVEHRGVGGLSLAVLSALLVAALSLVAPTNGLCNPRVHELLLVHPIFAHDHDPHAAHRTAADEASSGLDSISARASTPSPGIAPAGPFGEGLGLAIGGMLGGNLLAVLGLALILPLAASRRALVQQAWAEVPTGPPR